jgi:hypothetical protein
MSRYLSPTKCRCCPTIFKPKRSTQVTCSPACGAVLRERTKKRKARKQARTQTLVEGGLEILDKTQQSEGQNAQARSPWSTPVETSSGAAAWRSVTKAKPPSVLERRALVLRAVPRSFDSR